MRREILVSRFRNTRARKSIELGRSKMWLVIDGGKVREGEGGGQGTTSKRQCDKGLWSWSGTCDIYTSSTFKSVSRVASRRERDPRSLRFALVALKFARLHRD